jgi:fructose-1,6-bisphosphatase II
MRCLGGEIQGRLTALNSAQEQRLADMGIDNLQHIYSTEELAPGDHIMFSCTGVTDGELLRGARFFGGGTRTSTLFMSLAARKIQFVDTIHREKLTTPVIFQ